jgi:hypothetical protein
MCRYLTTMTVVLSAVAVCRLANRSHVELPCKEATGTLDALMIKEHYYARF